MTDGSDPFIHHPELRDRIADPMTSRFRQLDLAHLDAQMQAAGMPADWRASDAEREASRQATLAMRPGTDLWVFGYGSLIWDPGVHFAEVRLGRVHGLQRSFCLLSELGRGSRDRPGVMVGLDEGGHCDSLVFRIRADVLEHESRLLWQREMLRNTYQPRFVPVRTTAGELTALTFVVNPRAEHYVGELGLDEAARLVASGEGLYGTCREYVGNLVGQLDAFGIEDAGIRRLYQKACELTARTDG